MATSSVPAAIDGLLETLRAAPGLTGVDIHDGPPVTAESLDYVCVGHDPVGGAVAVDVEQRAATLGNRSREETFDILCALAAWSGDEDVSARRTRAAELFSAVETAVRQNVTLGGAVRTAQVAGYSLLQESTDAGVSVGYRFRIACTARI